ncbi:UNVERIFIED_CONTAM: hypothetical protein Sradi_1320800, partial [Sesamum radiatum]
MTGVRQFAVSSSTITASINGDSPSLISEGPYNLVLDVMGALLKALQSCEPLRGHLLLGRLRGSLSCSCRRRRYMGTLFCFFFRDVHIRGSGYT